MILTALFRLRANDHDARRLRVAMARWHAAFAQAHAMAAARQGSLLKCLIMWESKDGQRRKLIVSRPALHQLLLPWVTERTTSLHSSASMSMVVALEEMLCSWLALHAEWINDGRTAPRPAFPSLSPGSDRLALGKWEMALLDSLAVRTVAQEDKWRAAVTRAARGKLLPMYFGAATSGLASQAHCGILRREDGKLFALLTLFPQGDPLGEPVRRANNRLDRGAVQNVADTAARTRAAWERACRKAERAGQPAPEEPEWHPTLFTPTERARASIMVPLEFGRGHERLFLARATPKSAELVKRPDGFYLHVVFEFPDHLPRESTGAVLAVRRGIASLASWVLLGPDRTILSRGHADGRELARLLAGIYARRAKRQAEGKILTGDRRASRVAEHHLYSAGHQIVDAACLGQTGGAQIVLLEDPGARKPQRLLRWKHFHRLAEILEQLAAEAGLPKPLVRPVYASWKTCAECGWKPGDAVRYEEAGEQQCAGCNAAHDPDVHLARLLALDALRLQGAAEGRPTLADFIRGKMEGGGGSAGE